jgi:hypothetical protein
LVQAKADGGLGIGTLITSLIFLALILLTVAFLMFSGVDVAKEDEAQGKPAAGAGHNRASFPVTRPDMNYGHEDMNV